MIKYNSRQYNNVPLWETVLDVVEGRVDEYTCIVPGARLDADRLVDETMLREILVGDRDS
jgi:hypothetical protein